MSRKFRVPIGVLPLTANPSAGATGDLYYNSSEKKFYVYDGSSWAPVQGYTVSTSAPSSPVTGDRWVNSNTGIEYTYLNDGNSSQWVQIR